MGASIRADRSSKPRRVKNSLFRCVLVKNFINKGEKAGERFIKFF